MSPPPTKKAKSDTTDTTTTLASTTMANNEKISAATPPDDASSASAHVGRFLALLADSIVMAALEEKLGGNSLPEKITRSSKEITKSSKPALIRSPEFLNHRHNTLSETAIYEFVHVEIQKLFSGQEEEEKAKYTMAVLCQDIVKRLLALDSTNEFSLVGFSSRRGRGNEMTPKQ